MPVLDLDALEQALIRVFVHYGPYTALTTRELAKQINDELHRCESLEMTERITGQTFRVAPDGEPHSLG